MPVGGVGTSGIRGGIKLNDRNFFDIDVTSGALSPTFVSIGASGREGYSAFRFKDGYDLFTNGNIYCNTLVGEREVDITQTILQVEANYIGINIEDDGNSKPDILLDTEYSGLRFYNFKSGQESLVQSQRDVAELSINNKGILEFTKNVNITNNREQVLTLKRTNLYGGKGYLYAAEDSLNGYTLQATSSIPITSISGIQPLSITVNGTTTNYNVTDNASVNISIDNTYCKTITLANGETYSVSSNDINLPINVFSSEDSTKLNSAVQKVSMNGYDYQGNTLYLPSTSSVTDIIEVNVGQEQITIRHNAPEGYRSQTSIVEHPTYDVTTLPSNIIELLDTINYDSTGHTQSFHKSKLDFSTLLSKISELETRLSAAEARIATLEEQIEAS